MSRPLRRPGERARVPDAVYVGSEVHRSLAVKGSGGVDATVRVLVRNGKVWLSIEPHFTWEAIMQPNKVDELVRTLEIARDEARNMVRRTSTTASRPSSERGRSGAGGRSAADGGAAGDAG